MAKCCAACNVQKRDEMFNRSARSTDGLQAYCRECQRAKKAEWDDANREHVNRAAREWKAANPERHREYMRQWHADNPEKDHLWREANSGIVKAANRRSKRRHRAHHTEYQRLRRSRKVMAPPALISQGRKIATEDSTSRCYWCGDASPSHRDHIHPLSRGGAHCDENLVWACAPCNMSKGARSPLAWLAELVS